MTSFKFATKYMMAFLYIIAGINHFYNTQLYMRIMPPYLPLRLLLVLVSGIFEIVLGVMLMIPKYSRLAAWGLIGLLIAVFPANIHMARNTHMYSDVPDWFLIWIRLPLQLVLILWAWWYTRE